MRFGTVAIELKQGKESSLHLLLPTFESDLMKPTVEASVNTGPEDFLHT